MRIIEFKTDYAKGRGVDKVLLAPSGENLEKMQTWHRVAKLDPDAVPEEKREGDSYAMLRMRWDMVGPAYEAWRKDQAIPETGTPLPAWAGVTPQQVAVLRKLDLRTVEELADASEGTLQKMPFVDSRRLKTLAQAFLDGRSGSDAAEALAAANDRIAAMEEMLREMQADSAEDTPPKRRGRPPKAEAEAEAA